MKNNKLKNIINIIPREKNTIKYIKKGDLINIQYLDIYFKKIKKKQITGICSKNNKKTISIKLLIKTEIIEKTIDIRSPLLLKIYKIK